jgi:hypothetical protein
MSADLSRRRTNFILSHLPQPSLCECLLFDSVLKVQRTRLQLSVSLSARNYSNFCPNKRNRGLRRLYTNLLFAANVDECAVIRRERDARSQRGTIKLFECVRQCPNLRPPTFLHAHIARKTIKRRAVTEHNAREQN